MRGSAFAVLFSALVLAAPAFADDVPDAWSTGAPPDPQWEDTATPVLSADLVTLADDVQASALKRLAKKPIVPLDAKTAAKLMGAAPAPADAALKPYLVRGILLDGAVGGFTAERNGSALWIACNGLSDTPPKPLHRALIVFLADAPAQVYVTASYTN